MCSFCFLLGHKLIYFKKIFFFLKNNGIVQKHTLQSPECMSDLEQRVPEPSQFTTPQCLSQEHGLFLFEYMTVHTSLSCDLLLESNFNSVIIHFYFDNSHFTFNYTDYKGS